MLDVRLPGRSGLDFERELSAANSHSDHLFGGGRLDLVELVAPDPGYFKLPKDARFEPFQRFASLPALD